MEGLKRIISMAKMSRFWQGLSEKLSEGKCCLLTLYNEDLCKRSSREMQ